jgi:hypothetical protein
MLGLGPFLAAAYFYWRSRGERRPELTALAIGAGGALACNLALRLGGMEEYKLYSAAGLLVVAPAVLGIGERIKSVRRLYGWITWGSIIALAGVMASYSKHRIPQPKGPYLTADERGFFLSLGPRNPDSRWMAAVRVKCEVNTVLVIDRPDLHVSAFTARRLLVGSEGTRMHAGCNQPSRFNLVELRGYDPDLVDRRLELVQRVFRPIRPTSDEEKAKLLKAIAAEAGPNLAFVFLPGDDRSFLEWLRKDRRLRMVYDDGVRTVVEP